MNFLSGKKTYVAAGLLVITAIGGFLMGDCTLGEMVTTLLEGLGLAALRLGMSNG